MEDVQGANACLDDFFGCATTQLQQYLPDLDTQICATKDAQDKFTDGEVLTAH